MTSMEGDSRQVSRRSPPATSRSACAVAPLAREALELLHLLEVAAPYVALEQQAAAAPVAVGEGQPAAR